jgi:hypothetical protein
MTLVMIMKPNESAYVNGSLLGRWF